MMAHVGNFLNPKYEHKKKSNDQVIILLVKKTGMGLERLKYFLQIKAMFDMGQTEQAMRPQRAADKIKDGHPQ